MLWVNPIGCDLFDTSMKKYLNTVKEYNTELDIISFKKGPCHVEYQFYEALMGLDILRAIKNADLNGYDAAVIGCFYDPYLNEAREISNLVITAPAESSLSIAITLGHKFSIIVGRKKWIPQMEENVLKYGLKGRLASFHAIDMGVLEFQTKKEETETRLIRAGKEAIERAGAEVIILGCTAEFGFYKKMQKELNIPVIDATIASLKYAEFLIDLKRVAGWQHSKIGKYESPPTKEIKKWNIESQFGFRW